MLLTCPNGRPTWRTRAPCGRQPLARRLVQCAHRPYHEEHLLISELAAYTRLKGVREGHLCGGEGVVSGEW